MSWNRNMIGDVKHVIAMIDDEGKKIIGRGESGVSTAMVALESGVAKVIGKSFESDGKKIDAAGNALTALGVHVESMGHFNFDGSGSCTIKISSTIGVAAKSEVLPPTESPALEAPSMPAS